ncbi:MAG: SseB family protein [Nocardioidaceae bacterium]
MPDLLDPGFAGDDGGADPAVAEALAGYADGKPFGSALAAVATCRLLVPVVTNADQVETAEHGLAGDETAHMAAVLMRGRDGRLALLAFTGVGPLQAWDSQARPVPLATPQVAQAALAEGAAAVVVDVAGPVQLVIEGDDLDHVSQGQVLAPVGAGYAWVAPTHGD